MVETLKEEIDKLQSGKALDDPEALLDTMFVLGHLEEAAAFPPLLALAEISPTLLEDQLGEHFISEDWPRLLTSTAHGRWDELRERIQNTDFEDAVDALLTSVEYVVLEGQIPREPVIAFIKDYLLQNLRTPDVNKRLGGWICLASTLWPHECLEEIKELYGMRLIDTQLIDIDCVLEDYQKGLEECFVRRMNEYQHATLVDIHDEKKQLQKEERLEKSIFSMKKALKSLKSTNKIEPSNNQLKSLSRSLPRRNDPCSCGSGKKFKKCCIGSKHNQPVVLRMESYEVTYEPLDCYPIDEDDIPIRETIYGKLRTDPEACIKPLTQQMQKYPEDTSLYNYLYIYYVYTNKLYESHALLLKTVELFPDYLFGLVEFASYLLRRGDYDKVLDVFKGSQTLKQLYPEREVFHISEVLSFHYLMGVYSLKVDGLQQAKVYLSILEEHDKDCSQAMDLRKAISAHMAVQALKKFSHSK